MEPDSIEAKLARLGRLKDTIEHARGDERIRKAHLEQATMEHGRAQKRTRELIAKAAQELAELHDAIDVAFVPPELRQPAVPVTIIKAGPETQQWGENFGMLHEVPLPNGMLTESMGEVGLGTGR